MPEKAKTHGKKSSVKQMHHHHGEPHDHPDHSIHLKRLHKVKGQIEGIEKMILDQRYCPDIINQVKAASAALKAVEAEIFKSHLRGCVKDAFNSKDSFKAEEKIQEVIKMVF